MSRLGREMLGNGTRLAPEREALTSVLTVRYSRKREAGHRGLLAEMTHGCPRWSRSPWTVHRTAHV